LHHESFRGSLGSVVLRQNTVVLQQNISSRELAKGVLLQDNLSRQPASSSGFLRKTSLQQNKLAEPLERAAVMQNNDDLQQEDSARLWEK
jgi:hypothetical protein